MLTERDSPVSPISCGEGVITDFAGIVCTRYSSLVRAQSSTNQDGVNAVLTEAQMQKKQLARSRWKVSENDQLLHISGTDSEKKRVGSIPRHSTGGDGAKVGPLWKDSRSLLYDFLLFKNATFVL